MLLSATRALAFMHRNKIVHRDVQAGQHHGRELLLVHDRVRVDRRRRRVAESSTIASSRLARATTTRHACLPVARCDRVGGQQCAAADIELRLRKAFDVYAMASPLRLGRNVAGHRRCRNTKPSPCARRSTIAKTAPRGCPGAVFPSNLDNADGTIDLLLQEDVVWR